MGTEIDAKIYFPLRGLATVLQQTSLESTCGPCVHRPGNLAGDDEQ